jgi:hypothetical protein
VSNVAVLFARRDSVYKTMPGLDVWDIDRDARKWPGGAPIVAHPPCRAWGRLRHFAKPRHDEKDLARFAVAQIREHGGVLEHPEASQLWEDQSLPAPGERDSWGGWTLPVHQYWWGHRAQKKTLLYIVGCEPSDVPAMPLRLGTSDCVIRLDTRRADGTYVRRGDPDYKPRLQEAEREGTPPEFAAWLVELARSTSTGRCIAVANAQSDRSTEKRTA